MLSVNPCQISQYSAFVNILAHQKLQYTYGIWMGQYWINTAIFVVSDLVYYTSTNSVIDVYVNYTLC